ncbi:hypothetical protein FS594_27275 (plasmid) [Rahnella aquatilis]|nr:hypothetical protein FS594_27275 [Rahnella aquatilis]
MINCPRLRNHRKFLYRGKAELREKAGFEDELRISGKPVCGYPEKITPAFGEPGGDSTPYISFENGKYNYICSERGYEFSRKVTSSIDELLYWRINDFAHAVAVDYELSNRIPGKDSQRIYFHKIIELMRKINENWGLKAQSHLVHRFLLPSTMF